MMNPSGTKFSGDKIVPQSEFRPVQRQNHQRRKVVHIKLKFLLLYGSSDVLVFL
jgi:hypothetical protein